MDRTQVYTLDEVGEILQLTKRTLYTYIYNGKLDAVKIGKVWRVKPESLDTLLRGDKF